MVNWKLNSHERNVDGVIDVRWQPYWIFHSTRACARSFLREYLEPQFAWFRHRGGGRESAYHSAERKTSTYSHHVFKFTELLKEKTKLKNKKKK